jgi:hypothetical protein
MYMYYTNYHLFWPPDKLLMTVVILRTISTRCGDRCRKRWDGRGGDGPWCRILWGYGIVLGSEVEAGERGLTRNGGRSAKGDGGRVALRVRSPREPLTRAGVGGRRDAGGTEMADRTSPR